MRDIEVIGVDTEDNLGGIDRGLADRLVPLAPDDWRAICDWCLRNWPVGAVLTFREQYVEATAVVAEKLGLAGNSPQVVRTIRTKDVCRARLRRHGFRQPDAVLATNAEDLAAFLAATAPGPWIVKPRAGMGSADITLAATPAAVEAALALAGPGDPRLVETFVDGAEYSAEGVVVAGRPRVVCLTEKVTGRAFIEVGHRMPARLAPAAEAAACAEVERALRCLGVTSGMFHVEFWRTGEDVVLGEVHVRPGGDFLPALVERIHPGLGFYGMLLDDLLGDEVAPVPERRGAAGVDYFMFDRGELVGIDGWDLLLAQRSVTRGELHVRVGDRVAEPRDSADRHGYFLTTADTVDQVERDAARARAGLRVRVEPDRAATATW